MCLPLRAGWKGWWTSPNFRFVHFLCVSLSFHSRPFSLLLSEFISLQYSHLHCIVLLLSYRFAVLHVVNEASDIYINFSLSQFLVLAIMASSFCCSRLCFSMGLAVTVLPHLFPVLKSFLAHLQAPVEARILGQLINESWTEHLLEIQGSLKLAYLRVDSKQKKPPHRITRMHGKSPNLQVGILYGAFKCYACVVH